MLLVTVDPETAKWLLERNYDNNRTVNKSNVEKFARMINDGNWNPLFGSPMQFNPNDNDGKGVMYDAQHRCLAVIETGKTIEMLLNTNVSAKDYSLLDAGKSRSRQDALTGSDKQKRASFISYVLNYENNGYTGSMFRVGEIPNSWVGKWDEEHPGVAGKYTKIGDRTRDSMGSYGSGSAFAFFAYLLSFVESEKADIFKTAMVGKLIPENEEHLIAISNMKAVERRLKTDSNNHLTAKPFTSFLYVVRAWNAFVSGAEISKIQLNLDKNGNIKFIPMELLA